MENFPLRELPDVSNARRAPMALRVRHLRLQVALVIVGLVLSPVVGWPSVKCVSPANLVKVAPMKSVPTA